MVSRGTMVETPRQVRQLALADFELAALAGGELRLFRIPVTGENSRVKPGAFDGVDLETGRSAALERTAQIRARCAFPSGKMRAVSLSPIWARGDLFWITPQSRRRADSEFTLEVIGLGAKRLQDCGDEWAQLMGAGYIARDPARVQSPRARFARRWDAKWPTTIPEAHRWHRNPWCWEIAVNPIDHNVDWWLGHALEGKTVARKK